MRPENFSDTGRIQADTQKQSGCSASDTGKGKQINIRLTAEQDRLLRQHCVRQRVTLRDVVVDALARQIDGFQAN
jgi:hypothetical protein